jgi:hypothetical protein
MLTQAEKLFKVEFFVESSNAHLNFIANSGDKAGVVYIYIFNKLSYIIIIIITIIIYSMCRFLLKLPVQSKKHNNELL